jgi:excinuclease UvrABC ATPase subunit
LQKGSEGEGHIITEGSLEDVARNRKSFTGQALGAVLSGSNAAN